MGQEEKQYFKDYNTQRDKLVMPEHGRNVQKMIRCVLEIEDPVKRKEQLQAVVDVMRSLESVGKDSSVSIQKLWDHIQMISDYSLKEGDSPYPLLGPSSANERPAPVKRDTRPIRATHYGRNIECMIEEIAKNNDDETRASLIRALAIYMRQQYLIWNKDTVSDETIFKDIENMSGGKIKVPEGMVLAKIASDANFSRPGMNPASKHNRNQNNKKNKGQQSKRRN